MHIKREGMGGGELEGESLMNSLEFCCKKGQRNGVIRELGIKGPTLYEVKEFVNRSRAGRRDA